MRTRSASALIAGLAIGALCVPMGAVAGNLLTGRDILDGSIGSRDIRDGTLSTDDFRRSSLKELEGSPGPAGPPGPQGSEGPQGPPGAAAPASVSGPDIAAIGDSMTGACGLNSYPRQLQRRLDQLPNGGVVNIFAMGGETSAEVAGRAGGRPWLATVEGGNIPAGATPVSVTVRADTGELITTAPAPGLNPVRLQGVDGTLSLDAAGRWQFTRTAAGEAVPVIRPAAVITSAAREHRDDLTIMWWGQNDSTDTSGIIARAQATIQELTTADKRWLVIGVPSGTQQSRGTADRLFLDAFGRRFLNIREYLSNLEGLRAAGIEPTPADVAAVAEGSVPPSLRIDSVHPNDAGCAMIADAVWERMVEFGWDAAWR